MHKYLEAYENYDEDKANEIFTCELQSYSQSELINAINIYLSSHDMCKEFSLILIKQGNRNE
jgi:hypothetical protein